MKILILENQGSISLLLKAHLTQEGHEVYNAFNVNDARSYWESKEKKIDCIIVDLNMVPAGLTPAEAQATENGLITGWIWLKNYIFERLHEGFKIYC